LEITRKKAVVTGGAGFIGSHLVEKLVSRGYEVTVIDDLSSGKMVNIEPVLKTSNVIFVRGSVNDLALLQKLFAGVRYVFHQAAIASVAGSIADPRASHETNLTGTLNVLIAARDNRINKVVFASSAAVYGDNHNLPLAENMIPFPLSPYAVTKLAAEYYCHVFTQVYGLPTVCLRYFNVYGPRQDPDSEYSGVIAKFMKKAVSGVPLIIYGDGEQSRDFIFVRDVIEANMLAAENDASGVFNIGKGEAITINRLAQVVLNVTGSEVGIIHVEAKPGEIKHSLADIYKARQIGFEPVHILGNELSNMYPKSSSKS
jgi:UDP-glucose 4-epimerase